MRIVQADWIWPQLLKNDPSAWQALADVVSPLAHHDFIQDGSEVIQDVINETCVLVVEKLSAGQRPNKSFYWYVVGVYWNVRRRELRNLRKADFFDVTTDEDLALESHMYHDYSAKSEDLIDLRHCLSKLTKNYCDCVEGRYLHHYSYDYMSYIFGTSIGNVRTRVARGIALLRECLQEKRSRV